MSLPHFNSMSPFTIGMVPEQESSHVEMQGWKETIVANRLAGLQQHADFTNANTSGKQRIRWSHWDFMFTAACISRSYKGRNGKRRSMRVQHSVFHVYRRRFWLLHPFIPSKQSHSIPHEPFSSFKPRASDAPKLGSEVRQEVSYELHVESISSGSLCL